MPWRKKVSPSISNSSSRSGISPKNTIYSFRLRSIGDGPSRNTLVENDSLSSYSWQDETSHSTKEAEKAGVGATQDLNKNETRVIGQGNSSDPKSHNKGSVFINIETSPSTESLHQLTYIQAYMKFMYWTCVCPFDPVKRDEADTTTTWFGWMLSISQMICFAIIMALSVTQSFLEAKYFLLYNLYDGNLETFINMSYFFLNMASKAYYVYIFLRQQWKFTRMFKSMENLHSFKMRNSIKNKIPESSMKYTIVLGIVSTVVCLVHIIWDVGIMEWTPEKTLEHHFEEIVDNVLVWTLKEFENGTSVETFVERNGNGITATKIILGGLRMTMIFCSYLHNDALTNMMLTNAETINMEMRILEEKISNAESDTENVTLAEFLSENGDWAHFKLLKQALNDDNDAFDSLLKYKHANNLMLIVYFVLNVFDGEFSLTYVVRLLYNIFRASYTYRIATQASSLNEAERKWVRRLAWKSNDREFLERVPLILDELEKEPIGMGKGQFLIDESFLYRFIGSVGSVFVLQAQSREAKVDM